MDLDTLLTQNPIAVRTGKVINTSGEPLPISKGQFNYLTGLAREYLPDGHRLSYSMEDIQFDLLLDYRNIFGTRVMHRFQELTMPEAAKMIDWLKQETGK